MNETVKHARNLEEAAAHFGVSVPTLRRWLARGAPVVCQGGNGVAYRIDLQAMAVSQKEWTAAAARAREECDERRAERDSKLQLELLGPDEIIGR